MEKSKILLIVFIIMALVLIIAFLLLRHYKDRFIVDKTGMVYEDTAPQENELRCSDDVIDAAENIEKSPEQTETENQQTSLSDNSESDTDIQTSDKID